ncbi:hypothetical protein F53441_4111 [Fusarium austroafricanum]|uniref:Uncharacterized protein n=1 Tax=Fusarium austroafricanum TaxID=2364996 RepID=A0A8H4KL29_9HYPO|nr:hypothetical protein F53441_4111 [Fusarium austroafricanum]
MCQVPFINDRCVDCRRVLPNTHLNDPQYQGPCPDGGEWEFIIEERPFLCGECFPVRFPGERLQNQGQNRRQGQNRNMNQPQPQHHNQGQPQPRSRNRNNQRNLDQRQYRYNSGYASDDDCDCPDCRL